MFEAQSLEGFELSPQQRRIWSIMDGSGAFRARCLVDIDGELHREVFREAADLLVERHEILRTRFSSIPGIRFPLQVVGDDATPLEWVSAEEWSSSDLRGAESLDLENGPALRLELLDQGPRKYLLRISAPSLCTDAQGLDNLVAELARLYRACRRGEAPSDEPLQYADLAGWQNENLESEDMAEGREYWRQWDFSDRREELPWEKRSQASGVFSPGRCVRPLDAPVVRTLETAARAWDVPLPTVLLACWRVLLWRLGTGSKLAVGYGADGRCYEELQETPGLLQRYLPLRAHLAPGRRLPEVAAELEAAMGTASEWQDCFAVPESGTGAGGYSVLFDFEEACPSYPAGEVTFVVRRKQVCLEPFDLRLLCRRNGAALELEVNYDSRRFDHDAAERYAEHFEALLSDLGRDPATPIDRLGILRPDERRRILVDFNRTACPFPRDLTVHELFEARAGEAPAATALAFDEQQVSYGELDRRANALAKELVARGVARGSRVGLCFGRGPEMAVAFLAVSKAGATSVLLDPDLPAARLSFMIRASDAKLILTQERLRSELAVTGVELFSWQGGAGTGDVAPLPGIAGPDDIAYVVFTSGSTGRPKGVLIRHRSIVSYLTFLAETYALGPEDVVLQLARWSFDASVRDLLGPLTAGARVVLVPHAAAGEPRALLDALHRQRITRILSIVPTLLRELLRAGGDARAPGGRLSTVLASGEVLSHGDCRELRQVFGDDVRVVNQYGPTECTMTATYHEVREDRGEGSVSVGRPIANDRLHVLGADLEPVPVGVGGEIFLAGVGLASGYLDQPRATAERFLPDPFGGAGTRLYRTGDLGRYDNEGRVDYLGRADLQVKIRGQRIEPAEIEVVLRRLPELRDAVVVVRKDAAGEPHLVAYLETGQDAIPEMGAVRQALRRELPEVMVPSAFVRLDALPRTASGKLSRAALPEPDWSCPEPGRHHVAPRDPTERRLVEIWKEILGLERVGAEDDFFDLGGHSLLAIRLVSRVCEVFSIDIALDQIFEAPTVAELAARIEASKPTESSVEEVPPVPGGRDEEMPLSFIQQRMWVIDQLSHEANNVATLRRLRGPLNPAALERGVAEILRRHEVLRGAVRDVDGQPVLSLVAGTRLGVPRVDLRALDADRRERELLRLGHAEYERPFRWDAPPLMRLHLWQIEDRHHVLSVVFHHAVCDLWSLEVFFAELLALYRAFAAGEPSPLAELEIQYADYARWQRSRLEGENLERHLDYWRKTLAGTTSVLERLVEPPGRALEAGLVAVEPVDLPPDLAAAADELCRREGVTLFMLSLALFQWVLRWHTGLDDIVSGTYVAGRHHRKLENLVGCLASYLPLRTELSGLSSFRDLLGRVRDVVLSAQAQQALPYEKLETELWSELDLTVPRQVAVTMAKAAVAAAEPGPIEIEQVRLQQEEIRSERREPPILMLNLRDHGGAISICLSFTEHLLKRSKVRRIAKHFTALLERTTADPEVSLERMDAVLADFDRRGRAAEESLLAETSLRKLRRRRRRDVSAAA